MDKKDPYKHKERYHRWLKENISGIKEISLTNSSLILAYLYDMQEGLNVSIKSKKGPRSYTRLNNIIQRMVFLAKNFPKFTFLFFFQYLFSIIWIKAYQNHQVIKIKMF